MYLWLNHIIAGVELANARRTWLLLDRIGYILTLGEVEIPTWRVLDYGLMKLVQLGRSLS